MQNSITLCLKTDTLCTYPLSCLLFPNLSIKIINRIMSFVNMYIINKASFQQYITHIFSTASEDIWQIFFTPGLLFLLLVLCPFFFARPFLLGLAYFFLQILFPFHFLHLLRLRCFLFPHFLPLLLLFFFVVFFMQLLLVL